MEGSESKGKNDFSNRKRVPTGGGPKKTESPYTDIVLDIIGEDNPILAGLASAEAETEFMRGFQEGLGRDQDETTDSMASSTLSKVASSTDCLSYPVSRSCTPSNSRTSSPAPAVRMPSPAPSSRTPSPAPTTTSAAPKTVERKKTTGPNKKSGYVSTEKTREELHKELFVLEIAKTKLEKRKLSREIIKLNLEIEVLNKTKKKEDETQHGEPTASTSMDVQYPPFTTVSSFQYQTYTSHAAEDIGGITSYDTNDLSYVQLG